MFKFIRSGTAQKTTTFFLRNYNSSKKSTTYLNTVLNINFMFDREVISGDLLLHNIPKDLSSTLNKNVQLRVEEFVKQHGLNDAKYIERVNGVSYYSIRACPNLTEEQYAIGAISAAIHLLFDEIFDDHLLDEQHIEIVKQMCGLLCKYFHCEVLPISKQIRDISPEFENICGMCFDLGKKLLDTGRDLSHIYQGFDLLVEGYVTQVTLPSPKSAEEYLQRKARTFGMHFYFSLMASLAGESLSTEIRNSAWFREFETITATMPALYIDPLSFTFDTARGKVSDNYTNIFMKQGYSVKEAFEKTIIRYNRLVIKTLLLLAQLDKINVSEADRRYLRLYLCSVKGGLDWAVNYLPYNPQSMMKYLEIQDERRTDKCVIDVLRAVPVI